MRRKPIEYNNEFITETVELLYSEKRMTVDFDTKRLRFWSRWVVKPKRFIALVCVYLHGFSIKCFTSNFVLLSTVFFFALSGKLF